MGSGNSVVFRQYSEDVGSSKAGSTRNKGGSSKWYMLLFAMYKTRWIERNRLMKEMYLCFICPVLLPFPVYICTLCSFEWCSHCPCPCLITFPYPPLKQAYTFHQQSPLFIFQGHQREIEVSSTKFGIPWDCPAFPSPILHHPPPPSPVQCLFAATTWYWVTTGLQLTQWVHPVKIPLVLFVSLITLGL